MTNQAVLSIDVELFEQTPAYRTATGSMTTNGVGIDGLRFLRQELRKRDITTTCFVVSSLVEDFPTPIRVLADEGHEIGSHTHSHKLLSKLEPAERQQELQTSCDILESVTGNTPQGFRAPAFDTPPEHYRMLGDAGYQYDASIVPSRRIPGWYGGEHNIHRPCLATTVDPEAPADLTVVPTSVIPGLRLPLTGTWLRFFGPQYTILGMRLLARRGITPILYVHPWEFVELPTVDGVPRRVYFRTGDWMRRAVSRILDRPFDFTTIQNILAEQN
ncbi:polysaccharide deacetylase family protein [Halorubrum ezzemoulense]|uniref:polysaccharide deacetylase family protein n=1 Tax=Halorubrum ezzemoulense TaxID=337243 RepID=UPI00232E401F|nr:polysaccharide deacetylase family protein [Halorubrum ezzemoulense]MDB9281767.1 polysaccharide deacetylase family protein [Halorubrum ezzemoulense]MDB9285302.1 polysaccharide deacetylase family protein [Halorubrum ezzemoulense]